MLKYFLGAKVTEQKHPPLVSKNDLLREMRKLGAKPSSTLIILLQLIKDDDLFDDPERYKWLVEKLNYLRMTHPNIAYSINTTSQFIFSPIAHYWATLK